MEPARHIIKSAEAKAESLGWVIAAIVMAITIVGLPWARAAFSIATYTLLPFGYKAIFRPRRCRHRPVGGDRQHRVAASRRMVVGTGPPRHGDPARPDPHFV